ncbi:MAG: hypothetical protein IIA73_01410 [Proteobacteria bacterium]|nr:hypothetical protein [Pseudomonadota bacterium]
MRSDLWARTTSCGSPDISTIIVAGRGGSINVASPVVAGGMIYLSSGYDFPPEVTGNVLLGFSVD